MIELSVVIPSYNSADRLSPTLSVIAEHEKGLSNIEVVVVDDGSNDDTRDVVASHSPSLPHLQYLFSPRTPASGRSHARNLGIEAARGRILLFMDAGVLPGPGLLEAACSGPESAYVNYLTLGLFAGPMDPLPDSATILANIPRMREHVATLDPRDRFFVAWTQDPSFIPAPWLLAWTCALSVPRNDAVAVRFDTEFSGWGAEDVDFAARLDQRGLDFAWRTDVVAVHYPHSRERDQLRSHSVNAALLHRKLCTRESELFALWHDGFKVNLFAARLDRLWLEAFIPRCDFTEEVVLAASRDKILFAGIRWSPQLRALHPTTVLAHQPALAKQMQSWWPDANVLCLLGVVLPFADHAFEQVVLGDVLRALPRDIQTSILREMSRVAALVTVVVGIRPGLEHGCRHIAGWGWSSLEDLTETARWAGLSLERHVPAGEGIAIHLRRTSHLHSVTFSETMVAEEPDARSAKLPAANG